MKNGLKVVLTAGVMVLPLAAFSLEKTVDVKTEQKIDQGHAKGTFESKTVTDPGGAFNSTTDKVTGEKDVKAMKGGGTETTLEKKMTHDAPGMKHDRKKMSKDRVVRDASGNVIEAEHKTE